MIFLSLVLFCLIFFILSEIVIILRPGSITGTFALSMAGFVGMETIVFNGLSLFHGINMVSLAVIHFSIIAGWLCWVYLSDKSRPLQHGLRFYYGIKSIFFKNGFQLLFPLLVLVGLTAWLYPPNNYDSLTYHMGRVAHWIQNGSIDYYPTIIDRQNQMGPGAEYLILFLQVLSGTDYYASFVQFFSYICLILSCFYIVRVLKAPRKLSLYIVLLSTTSPIAILQASNTKNDLVAALMTIAFLVSSNRFIFGSVTKLRLLDFVFIGISAASGFLVKPTSLLVGVPIVAIGLCFQLVPIIKRKENIYKLLSGTLITGIAFFSIAGPDLYRKTTHHVSRYEAYPIFSGYDSERFWNPVKVIAHNVPISKEIKNFFVRMGLKGELRTSDVFNLHEDMVGNPFQVFAFLFLSAFTVFLFFLGMNKKYWKLLLLGLSPVASWAFFGLIVKDQAWITRLEMPLFFILPFSFVYITALSRSFSFIRNVLYSVTFIFSLSSLSYVLFCASNVPARPLVLSHFWGEKPSRDSAYYNNAHLKEEHDFFIQAMDKANCNRIGLILGPDSVDYPLTWRIMQRGATAKHLWFQDHTDTGTTFIKLDNVFNEVCMIYVATGSVEHVPQKGEQWVSAGDYHTYIRNSEWDFDQSEKTCLNIDEKNISKQLIIQKDLSMDIFSKNDSFLAIGDDPQFFLPEINNCVVSSPRIVLRIEMNSSVDTIAQVFYQSELIPYYTESQSDIQEVRKGKNILYFRIPLKDLIGHIRFDSGKKQGEYQIQSLVIRTVQ